MLNIFKYVNLIIFFLDTLCLCDRFSLWWIYLNMFIIFGHHVAMMLIKIFVLRLFKYFFSFWTPCICGMMLIKINIFQNIYLFIRYPLILYTLYNVLDAYKDGCFLVYSLYPWRPLVSTQHLLIILLIN